MENCLIGSGEYYDIYCSCNIQQTFRFNRHRQTPVGHINKSNQQQQQQRHTLVIPVQSASRIQTLQRANRRS